ncbi:MAG: SDR family oxidoreductase [Eubacteriales bacterium]|nr:SDR family oxidoreductase [Eubacteriales bacterium]
MKILITGTSSGIGKATAEKFLNEGFEVYGFDKMENTISGNPHFHFSRVDIRDSSTYPAIPDMDILFNNAGVQDDSEAIDTNLKGTISITEKYAFQKNIKSVLFNASSSAHTGFEFPSYSASKAGVLGYMKNVAWRLAKKYHATVNSLSFGGVLTPLNREVEDEESFQKIMDVTPLKKWMTPQEAAEWVYFLTVINKSCTGQDILIDNGEKDLNCTFVWPGFDK